MSERAYTIPISNGLLDPKHCRTIGDALWLFIYLVDKQTRRVDKNGHGKVSGGMPIRDKDIAGTLGCSSRTIIRWREVLVRHSYITTRRTPYGCVYAIAKPKKWTQKSPVSPEADVTEMSVSPMTELSVSCPGDMTRSVERYDTTCINKEDVTRDYKNNKSVVVDSLSEMEEESIQQVWDHFCCLTGQDPDSFSTKQRANGAARLKDALGMREGDLGEAVELMTGAIETVKAWPKRKGPVRWEALFGDTATFEKWTRDTNDKLNKRVKWVEVPPSQEKIDREAVSAAIWRVIRLVAKGDLLAEVRISTEIRRHIEGMPAKDAVAMLDGMTEEDVRRVSGSGAALSHCPRPDVTDDGIGIGGRVSGKARVLETPGPTLTKSPE